MAANETIAMINATMGKMGNMGTLNGRSSPGSFFLSVSKAIIDTIYNVSAPNTEIVMMSAVFLLSKTRVIIPIVILTNRALAGV